jgi:galactitol-specific phosphotransferase system IIC component
MATGGPKLLNGKIVIQAYMLDNSYKTVLIEPHSTVQVGWPAASSMLWARVDDHLAIYQALAILGVNHMRRIPTHTVCRMFVDLWLRWLA